MSPAPLSSWWAEQLHPRWRVVAEAAVAVAAFAAAAVVSIAAAVVASIAAGVMVSMARPWLSVRVAGGTPTVNASAGGNPGSIAA